MVEITPFPIVSRNAIPVVISPLLDACTGLAHAFSTRNGGISKDAFSSMNLASANADGDSPENVYKNRALFLSSIGSDCKTAVRAEQVHGNTVVYVTARDCGDGILTPPSYKCDGFITDTPNVALSVSVADCVPVLIFDPKQHAIAAIHAGWRSTARAIVRNAVTAMSSRFGSNPAELLAAIGPSIGACCFVTCNDVRDAMLALPDGAAYGNITPCGDKYHVDLPEINRSLLLSSGLLRENIQLSGRCTCCDPDNFFSHRRTGHPRGGMAAAIMLLKTGENA